MQPKSKAQALADRLDFWENELEIELSAHPEPAQRLDYMIERMINDEAQALVANNELRSEVERLNKQVATLQKVIADQTESVAQVTTENNRLRYRWSSLRDLLGITNFREEKW